MALNLSKLGTYMREGSSIIGLAGGGAALTSYTTGALTWQQAAGGFVFALIAVGIRQLQGTVVQGNAVLTGDKPVVQTDTTTINTGSPPA